MIPYFTEMNEILFRVSDFTCKDIIWFPRGRKYKLIYSFYILSRRKLIQFKFTYIKKSLKRKYITFN